LNGEKESANIGIEGFVEMLLGDLAKGSKAAASGIGE
jgi:hypothetical protein